MSGFRPTRASPPAKRTALPSARAGQTAVSDISRSSAVSTTELQGLTPQDIEFLDAVIQRASPTATTFLTVFKAYNDILTERGMDPQNEVVYYGKLLKLGTLKAGSWGEKWRVVKMQQGYDSYHSTHIPPAPEALPRTSARLTTRLNRPHRDDDLLTLHSHQDESEDGDTEAEPSRGAIASQYHHTPEPFTRQSTSEVTSLTHSNPSRAIHIAQPAARRQLLFPTARNVRTWDEASEDARTPSTVPPSYGAAVREAPILKPTPSIQRTRAQIERPLSAPGSTKATNAPVQPRERRKSMINEEDAWSKVKMLQDEREADQFREEKLVEKCWAVWRSGFEWLITTGDQISQARDNLLLRNSMERWRSQTASHIELESQVTTLANTRRLRVAFVGWRSRLKEKRQTDWRNDMRGKMKSVRENREGKLRKDAWAKWRQSYRSHLSGQHYIDHLVLRCFRKWRTRLLDIDHLEAAGDEFLRLKEAKGAERCLTYWRRAAELRNAERSVTETVSLRILASKMDLWKKRMHDVEAADAFYNLYLKKNFMRSWKAAQGHIQSLERRADKHLSRQNDILLLAVARVWKARERGQLLHRVKSVRLVKDAWSAWRDRMNKQKQLEDLALAFSTRSKAYTASLALQTWRQVHSSHRNALTFAMQYHSAQLQYNMILTWRLRLRSKLKLVKQGKIAQRFFIARRAWKSWRDQLESKKREKKLKEWEVQKLRKSFNNWFQRASRQRYERQAEQVIKQRVAIRTMKDALSTWTNRVIDIKLREIEIGQQNSAVLLASAFKKWKGVCMRHVEELSLMQSYQDVKRDENIRRLFHRWLTAARSARHRRLTLQRKEDEMKAACLETAWNKWRERFVDEKLRPIEYEVLIQTQRNMLFRAFGMWRSKTKSLPAIQFHASHAKLKYWEIWRAAMPQALRARKAREMDKRHLLSTALGKWLQVHRTKIALKAVARARYLRLPTSVTRSTASPARPIAGPSPTPRSSKSPFFQRTPKAEGSITDTSEAEPYRPAPLPASSRAFGARSGIASLLSSKPRSSASASRPKYSSSPSREPSPTRTQSSVAPGPETTLIGSRLPARSRSRGLREPSPARSRISFEATQAKGLRDREGSPRRISPSRPPSSAGGDLSRTKLWLELREVQRKSRPPTERSS